MIILVATLDEQLKKFNSSHPGEQTAEENVEKKMPAATARFINFLSHHS